MLILILLGLVAMLCALSSPGGGVLRGTGNYEPDWDKVRMGRHGFLEVKPTAARSKRSVNESEKT